MLSVHSILAGWLQGPWALRCPLYHVAIQLRPPNTSFVVVVIIAVTVAAVATVGTVDSRGDVWSLRNEGEISTSFVAPMYGSKFWKVGIVRTYTVAEIADTDHQNIKISFKQNRFIPEPYFK